MNKGSTEFDVHIDFKEGERVKQFTASSVLLHQSSIDKTGDFLRVWYIKANRMYHFQYSDGNEFFIDSNGKYISANWPSTTTIEDNATYLLGPIIGFALRLQGFVCLHASAVVFDNHAVAFLNPCGHGKSTIAAAFAKQGNAILTDDIVALVDQDNAFLVLPAYPRIRMWPDAVEALFGSKDALPRIIPDHPLWDKRYLDLTGKPYKFQPTPLPLSAIYTGKRDEALPHPQIDKVSNREGLLALTANSYSAKILNRKMHAKQFDILSRLAEHLPVKCFKTRKGMQYLPLLCEAIRDDLING